METPALEHLMGAYFHQDFDLQGGLWGTLELYLSDERETARLLPDEIRQLLATVASDAEIEPYLGRLGSCVYLGNSELTYRAWLEEIARRAAALSEP